MASVDNVIVTEVWLLYLFYLCISLKPYLILYLCIRMMIKYNYIICVLFHEMGSIQPECKISLINITISLDCAYK